MSCFTKITKFTKQELKMYAEDYANILLEPRAVEDQRQIILDWLDQVTREDRDLDDFILSIQDHPEQINAALGLLTFLFKKEIII